MPVRPRLSALDLPEAEDMLYGLTLVNLRQLKHGAHPISGALQKVNGQRRLRYVRADPLEEWLTIRDIWARGGGDCEDLAAAVAAELLLYKINAKPIIRRVGPGLAHAQVALQGPSGWVVIDPSRTGGMGQP